MIRWEGPVTLATAAVMTATISGGMPVVTGFGTSGVALAGVAGAGSLIQVVNPAISHT